MLAITITHTHTHTHTHIYIYPSFQHQKILPTCYTNVTVPRSSKTLNALPFFPPLVLQGGKQIFFKCFISTKGLRNISLKSHSCVEWHQWLNQLGNCGDSKRHNVYILHHHRVNGSSSLLDKQHPQLRCPHMYVMEKFGNRVRGPDLLNPNLMKKLKCAQTHHLQFVMKSHGVLEGKREVPQWMFAMTYY
jgi:hypothetical protein